jgi:hypothetical protein
MSYLLQFCNRLGQTRGPGGGRTAKRVIRTFELYIYVPSFSAEARSHIVQFAVRHVGVAVRDTQRAI